MSGPGGIPTKRDQRRESRRDQYQRRQLERQRERQRQLRNQQIRRWGIIGGGALIFVLVMVLIINAIVHSGAKPSGGLQPASGQVVDNLSCGEERVDFHIHSYLKVYVDGKQQTVPEGTGIVGSGLTGCLYPLHVHQGEPNIIHVEGPSKAEYTLGQFFDIWGQQLSATQFMGKPVDASHKLVVEILDVNGKVVQTLSGDPRKFVFNDHQTIVMLYNSPDVKPSGYDWNKFQG